MSTDNTPYTKRIVGYSDEISVRPGNNISFMVSKQNDKAYNSNLFLIGLSAVISLLFWFVLEI